ncbi:MAG: hypothetical protein WAM73_10930 [Desulfobacterales bacterium]
MAKDGKTILDVRLEGETLWLKLNQLDRLFEWDNSVISHILEYNEKQLREQEQKLADLRCTVGLLEQTLAHQAIGLDEAKGLLQSSPIMPMR